MFIRALYNTYLLTRPWPSGNMPTLNPMNLAAQILERAKKIMCHLSGHKRCRGLFRANCTYDLPTGSLMLKDNVAA